MATFEELGIGQDLVAAAAAMEWAAPTGLQEGAIPVIRRGNNVVLHASPGAGATGAFGLGILDRLRDAGDEDGGAPLVLVLTPDADAASRTAGSLARLAATVGLGVRALAPGWPTRPTAVLVTTAPGAIAAIGDSSLKLDRLVALVVDGADLIRRLGDWTAIETIVASIPADAQRVLVTGTLDAELDGFTERHVRRALTFPPRPDADFEPAPGDGPAVRFALVTEQEKTAAVSFLLPGFEPGQVTVICRTPTRAAAIEAELRVRGMAGDADDGPRVSVRPLKDADERSTRDAVLSFDVPFDAAALATLHGDGGAILATPRELPHLRRIAAQAGIRLQRERPDMRPPAGAAEAVRARLRVVLRDGDIAGDLALIEPLLADYSAVEVAAAALQLARARAEATPPVTTGGAAPQAPAPTATWVRLFVSAGSRDGLGPGDLVGAITGESALEGSKVGKIEIRENHSTVEVPAEAAERVIRALNGRTVKGRSLRVDYDRQERGARKPAPTRGGKPSGRPGGRPGGQRPGGGRPPRRQG